MGNTESNIIEKNKDIRKFSHFSHQCIKEWMEGFSLFCPNGYILPLDMENLLLMIFPFQDTSKFCKRLFKTINIAGSGRIDINELLISFSILTKGSEFEKIRWIFRFFDTDNDGIVSKEDLEDSISSIKILVYNDSKVSRIIDRLLNDINNKSGFLTLQDFEKLSEIHSASFNKLSC